jgi:hypothetical protein
MTNGSSLSHQELEWHERVRDALNGYIKNPNFFLWINVAADPGAALDVDDFRDAVERFLGGLDPDEAHEPGEGPAFEYESRGLRVVAHALAKKAGAREPHQQIVGNPVPATADWAR